MNGVLFRYKFNLYYENNKLSRLKHILTNLERFFLFLFIYFLFIPFNLEAQNPIREFRGVWVASVANIDFPERKGLNPNTIKSDWQELVEFYSERNFNALITQIRPVSDAFYPSKLAPWSAYLTGSQGYNPDKDFDPLAMMIDETHKKGLEFHAWLNPYRATMTLDTTKLGKTHPFRIHPEWAIKYGNKWYLNPGLPEVRNYITEIIEELLINYDIDAIHFDDYFYPYKIAGEGFPDTLDFQKLGFGFFSIDDWRRHNVDLIIEQISNKISAISPHVKFGISPFGVWRNQDKDPVNGSESKAGQTSYDDLFADVLKWMEEGWIDYLAPQLYWHIGYPPADYKKLIDWWNDHSYDRPIYVGLGAYKIADNAEQAWYSANEMPKQIRLSRQMENVSGNIYFSSKSLRKSPLGITDSLSHNYYKSKALMPPILHLDLEEMASPNLHKIKMKKGKIHLNWSRSDKDKEKAYCAVYRFEDSKPGEFRAKNILAILPISEKKNWKFTDDTFVKGKTYSYVVSILNRAHVESDLSNYRTVKIKSAGIKRIR
ncbi:MAG: family 10 glycosylhydrolase [Bacteroidetes bacterium]|jgi:uncharacterized lipoprotein YddW (UPF0748 family)|nr:family 10 glycosylhydrolase [Bacteroidota bacterium]